MILKIKGFIYRHTGIFLAHKEELEYLQSDEYWFHMKKMSKHKDNEMTPRNVQGLLIGLWQCKHGFYRSMSRREWNSFDKKRAKRNAKRRSKK